MVKSIVSQALARHEEERAKETPVEKSTAPKAAEDDEISKIVESLNVSIKIIGCGGGVSARRDHEHARGDVSGNEAPPLGETPL